MGTIMGIAEDTLKKAKDPMQFEDIFQEVQEQLMTKWQVQYNTLTTAEILVKCRGELYKMLTVSGKFARTADGLWTASQ